MKGYIFIFLITYSFSKLTAQPGNQIVIGVIDSIHSSILNEQRKIWIHVPSGSKDTLYAPHRYPVLYLLDGDGHFNSVAGMLENLGANNKLCPEMIVVAIPNTDRTRDLTPTHVVTDPPYVDSSFSKNSGGGENFISFIEKELMPYVESKYPVEPYRMFIGHSFGGLTVMNTVVHHPQLFNAYVAIDPSMWWDHEKLLNEARTSLSRMDLSKKSLYLGIANTMNEGMTIKKVRKDTAGGSRHIRSILNLNDYLISNKQNGLHYQGKYYGEDDHGSVPLITEYDALRFIFKDYRVKLNNKDFEDSTAALALKIDSHYKIISGQYGYPIKPNEEQVNQLGYQALNKKQYVKAQSLFFLNVNNYPDSYNTYDSYGDYFNAVGDTLHAIEQFKKELGIKENAGGRLKLLLLSGERSIDEKNASIQKYAGSYDFNGIDVKIVADQGILRAIIPGQPIYELIPADRSHEFILKGLAGYKIRFEMEGDLPLAIYSTQPDGMFKALRK